MAAGRNHPASRAATLTPVDWRDQAACRSEDPELFFPVGTTGPALQQIEDAKSVCRRCPVISPCLEFAMRTSQDEGIWGGTTTDERRALKKRRAQARTIRGAVTGE